MKPTADVWQAIETAIQIEKDGLAFYTEAARQAGDPNGKKRCPELVEGMFQSLARDEAAHLRLFETVHESLLKEGHWLSPEQVAAISPKRLDRSPIFPTGDAIKAALRPFDPSTELRAGFAQGRLCSGQAEVTAAIVGARRPPQIEETAPAGDWVLSAEDVAEIDALLAERERALTWA